MHRQLGGGASSEAVLLPIEWDSEFLRWRDTVSENGRACGNSVADLDRRLPLRPVENIDARAEFNVSNAFSWRKRVAGPLVADDSARDESGNLPAHNPGSTALYDERILFVFGRCRFMTGDQELAFLVDHIRDTPRDGRSVHMNIEDVEEYADAGFIWPGSSYCHHFSVRWRHHHIARGSNTFRVAEKVQTERRKYIEGNSHPGTQKNREKHRDHYQSGRVVDSVRNDPQDYIFSCITTIPADG